MKARTILALLIGTSFASIIGLLAFGFVERGGAVSVQPVPLRSNFSVAEARGIRTFDVYFAGENTDGLPLTAVVRREDMRNADTRADFVSFIYGNCTPIGDHQASCGLPAEVQVWPACIRHRALYDTSIPGVPVPEDTTIRGAPGAFFDDGTRLEIYSGRSTIVVFAETRERVLTVANALKHVDPAKVAAPELPAPAAGALEGKLSC